MENVSVCRINRSYEAEAWESVNSNLFKIHLGDVDVILKERFISPKFQSFLADAFHLFAENKPPTDTISQCEINDSQHL